MDKPTKFITICSGKGGVGKSFVAANLAYLLSQKGKTLLWDSNLNFPNLHLILGVDPPLRLNDYISSNVKFKDTIFKVKQDFDLIIDSPLSDRLDSEHSEKFYEIYQEIKALDTYDYVVIDTMPGAGELVLESCILSDLSIVLITDEPTTIVDSYGLLKLIIPFVESDKIGLLVNNVIDEEDYDEIISKINLTTNKFLGVNFNNVGFIPYDREVRKSIQTQELIIISNNNSPVSKNLHDICGRIEQYLKSKNLINENR
ncbi:MAG: P-loop NTPase [Candidatus Kapaibacterium sp.]